MDMDGLIALMANIDRIRASAIANLQGQAVAARDEVREVRRRRKD
jgi:hypothetical protein